MEINASLRAVEQQTDHGDFNEAGGIPSAGMLVAFGLVAVIWIPLVCAGAICYSALRKISPRFNQQVG